jgi:hypothetical protein
MAFSRRAWRNSAKTAEAVLVAGDDLAIDQA